MRHRPPGRGRLALVLGQGLVACYCALCLLVPAARALPDNRAFELVTRVASGGGAEAVGLTPDFLAGSIAGGAVDWEGFGGCCGASSGALNLFQSVRGPMGWQTRALTPKPSEQLSGFFEEQPPMAWTSELNRTVFATPVPYAAGDRRPHGSHAYDLYLQDASDGALKWLSQGPAGTGSSPVSAKLDGATPSLSEDVFSSAESLTPNAEGLGSENKPPQYLYLRNLAAETTSLLDVTTSGSLISPYGATLGNGDWLHEDLVPADYMGTTTNAISQDGSKVFFEAPPPEDETEGASGAHLYMRDLSSSVTTPLDEPSSSGSARYEGASADGSLVFFTSNEGLDGAARTTELYEFNTTSGAIGPNPAMSEIAIGGGKGVVGVTAIANDGETVDFVADSVLASNQNPRGASAIANEPNLYAYATATGQTTFVATVAWPDVSACDPNCASEHLAGLVAQPDTARPAYPTPDGSVLVFASSAAITGPAGDPRTTLSEEANGGGERTLQVASTSGFAAGQAIAIGGRDTEEEIDTIEAVHPPSEITLREYGGPDGYRGLAQSHAAGTAVTRLIEEVYRYSVPADSLECLSCSPSETPAGSSLLGPSEAGGSYAPDGRLAPLSENGAQVFFQSPNSLVPEVPPPPPGTASPPDNVYEWENGQIQLISNGLNSGYELDGATPNGDDVFISTHAQLTSINTGGDVEIYDARVNGGLPETPLEVQQCSGEVCRASALSGGITLVGLLPGSAILGATGGLEEQGPSVLPKLAVVHVTAGQVRRFARTGRLVITVAATVPGTIGVTASTHLRSKVLRVARATATLKGAASARLALTLDRSARRLLARAGTLALRIEVRDSDGATPTSIALLLRASVSTATRSQRRHA
jgi:hypothetical protein